MWRWKRSAVDSLTGELCGLNYITTNLLREGHNRPLRLKSFKMKSQERREPPALPSLSPLPHFNPAGLPGPRCTLPDQHHLRLQQGTGLTPLLPGPPDPTQPCPPPHRAASILSPVRQGCQPKRLDPAATLSPGVLGVPRVLQSL